MENRRNTLYVCETLYGKELTKYCKCLRTTKEYRRDLLKHGTPRWRLIQLENVYNLSHSTMRNDKKLFESELKEYDIKVSVRFFKHEKEIESYEIIEKTTYKNAGDIVELKDELLLDEWLNKHYDSVECDLSDYNQVDELDTPSKLINEVITVYGYDYNDLVYIYGG